jgi:hypothetical protein
MTNYNADVEDVKQLARRIEDTKKLETLPEITVTMSAVVADLMVTLLSIYDARMVSKRTEEQYAQYVQKQIANGKSDAQIDTWETWRVRNASYAFTTVHSKVNGEWEYDQYGEPLLQMFTNIAELAKDELAPVKDQIKAGLISATISA